MKLHFYFQLLLLLWLIFYLSSCGQGSRPPEKEIVRTATRNIIRFKVNGQQVTSSGWNISRFDESRLNITSNMHEDPRTISFNLSGSKPGSYTLSPGLQGENRAYGYFKPDYMDLLDAFSFREGTVSITGMDSVNHLIQASFYGTAEKNGERYVITEGEIINGELK